jgi:hypothetical protein
MSIEISQNSCFVGVAFGREMVARLNTIDERHDNRPKDPVGYLFHFGRRGRCHAESRWEGGRRPPG